MLPSPTVLPNVIERVQNVRWCASIFRKVVEVHDFPSLLYYTEDRGADMRGSMSLRTLAYARAKAKVKSVAPKYGETADLTFATADFAIDFSISFES